MATVYKFKAYFTKAGIGTAPANAPTVDVVDVDADSKLATAQAGVAKTNLVGYYEYEYSGADGLDLVAHFNTADTSMDQQDLCSYVTDKITTNLNAAVSTRATDAGVWAVATSTLTGVGTVGKYVMDMMSSLLLSLTGGVTIVSPVGVDGKAIRLVAGDDYSATDGRSLDWVLSGYPSLVGSTITFECGPLFVTGTAVDATHARVELTSVQTAQLELRRYTFRAKATLAGGRKVTFATGPADVIK